MLCTKVEFVIEVYETCNKFYKITFHKKSFLAILLKVNYETECDQQAAKGGLKALPVGTNLSDSEQTDLSAPIFQSDIFATHGI